MHSTQSVCRVLVLCFSVFLIGKVVSKPDGAPTAACLDMTPQHFETPQETDCPFIISPAKDEMWSNGTLEVSLELKNTNKFKGFLLMAFDHDSSSVTPIGTFSEPKDKLGKVIDCRKDGSKNAVTHNSRSPKSTVVVTWTPPEDFEGVVVFNTTFVQSLDMYWVKQSSTVVRVKRTVKTDTVSSNESTTKKPSSTTVAPSDNSKTESPTTWTSTVPPETTDSASPISLLAFYSVIIIGITIAFMA